MSTETPPDTGGADKEQPVEASYKRKREIADASEENVERTYDFRGSKILQCPICSKPFRPSSPVYQCENGHTACSACCKGRCKLGCPTCTLPLNGSNRCIAIETILKSLRVSCKYAQYGCRTMSYLPYGIGPHESYCTYNPIPCPVPECTFKGSGDTLPEHLTVKHHVRTVAYNEISAAGFTMESSDHMVMVNVNNTIGGGRDVHFVHREVHEALGEVFFCTTICEDHGLAYNLKVQHKAAHWQPTLSLKSALTQHLRLMGEYWKKDFLLLPMKDMCRAEQVEVHFRVVPGCPDDDD